MVKSTQSKEMADKVSSAGFRSAAKNKIQTAAEEEPERETSDSYRNEIILIVTLLISLFSLISILGIGGIVGNYFRTFIFGTMGLLGYFFPFVLFFAVIFILSNYQNKRILYKIFCCIGIYFVLMGLFQLLFYANSEIPIIEMYSHCAKTTLGGGFFGALFTMPLSSVIGVAGTCVVWLAVFFILLIFITSRFFLSAFGQKGERENRRMHQQYQEEHIENMVSKESYRELPPRKRKSSITFDLSEEDATAGAYMEETLPVTIASASSVSGDAEEIKIFSKQETRPSKKKQPVQMSGNKAAARQKKTLKGTEETQKEQRMEEKSNNNVKIVEAKAALANQKENVKKEREPVVEIQEKELETGKERQLEKQLERQKQPQKEPEMKEYEPAVKEGEPITKNAKEIRKELEQSLFAESPLREQIPGRPSVRFVDDSTRNKYVRKVIVDDMADNIVDNTSNDIVVDNIVGSIAGNTNNDAIDNAVDNISNDIVDNTNNDIIDDIVDNTIDNAINSIVDNAGSNIVNDMKKAVPLKEQGTQKKVQENENKIEAKEMTFGDFERFTKEKKFDSYIFPPINLLAAPSSERTGSSAEEIQATTERLRQTFESFKVRVNFGNVSCGPAVTRYEIQPEQGVKVSKITNLADDIKLNLAAADIRMEAPIPGKAAIGIEVPNRETSPVILRELLENDAFKNHKSKIAFAVGKDVSGQPIVTDIAKMPHLLIAGATGSGKSVCINTLIMSILYKSNPDDVKLIMVDPKVVELSVYNGIPHLLIPVVTDPKKASEALNWAVDQMSERYEKFAALGVRDLTGYNKKVAEARAVAEDKENEKYNKLPQIVIIVDELADLMMVSPGEVEEAICRLAQMARAAGLHLVIATQRPSVNVITGVIKANVPSRIAFSVSSAVDSRTIIDGVGAEKLLGKGDMLFFPSGLPKPIRVQGAFVSDIEVSHVVEFLREQNQQYSYDTKISDKIMAAVSSSGTSANTVDRDSYFSEAGKFIIEKEKASIGMLQRVYKIGFNRAARIMDQLADAGVVGPEEGTKPRKILMTTEEFEQYLEEYL